MKQCPGKCEICGGRIGDLGAIVGIQDDADEHSVWVCDKVECREAAVMQVDRGRPRFASKFGVQPNGRPGWVPDTANPLRGEIVVRVQAIQRVPIFLHSVTELGEQQGIVKP